MKRIARLAPALAALWIAGAALANDSVASMGAGGLVLGRTDGIEMRSEDLYVSSDEIRVAYRFFNRTGTDIETLVAFPLPDVELGVEDEQYGFEHSLEMFNTTVDGQTVDMRQEVRAFIGEREITDRLRAANLPVSSFLDSVLAALEAIDAPTRAALIAEGLVEADPYFGDAGLRPLWRVRTRYYRTQVFPAGREVSVRHVYRPAVGGAAWSIVGHPDAAHAADQASYRQTYCTDPAFVRGAQRMRAQGRYMTEVWVDYVLTTGANWAGPIGDFRLVVDKGDPANLVSFCGTGVRKIGPTTFEMRARNSTPIRDLRVLILRGEARAEN